MPNSGGWLGRYRAALTGATDYDIDREVQRTEHSERGFTGLASVPVQDRAISWSQGQRFDRSSVPSQIGDPDEDFRDHDRTDQ